MAMAVPVPHIVCALTLHTLEELACLTLEATQLLANGSTFWLLSGSERYADQAVGHVIHCSGATYQSEAELLSALVISPSISSRMFIISSAAGQHMTCPQ